LLGKSWRDIYLTRNTIPQILYDGAEVLIEAFQTFESGKTKIKCTGMSEKFNPLVESCQVACVRAVKEELKATVQLSDFCENPLLATVAAGSLKFKGLKSEYHLYYCALKESVCEEFQASRLPQSKITAVAELDSSTNPKTLWWAWCPDGAAGVVEERLEQLTAETPFAVQIDFRSPLKLGTPGEQVREELEVAKKMKAQGLIFSS
jgi:hypothetical protein